MVTVSYSAPVLLKVSGPGATMADTRGLQRLILSGVNFGPEGSLVGSVVYGTQPGYLPNNDMDRYGWNDKLQEYGCKRGWTGNSNASQCPGIGCCTVCKDAPMLIGEPGKQIEIPDLLCDSRRNKLFRRSSAQQELARVCDGSGSPCGIQTTDCKVTSENTEITCISGEGTGVDHWWVVKVEGQESIPIKGNTSYAPPVVEEYSGPGSKNADTAGGQVIHLTGRGFGSKIRNAISRVQYGQIVDGEMMLNFTAHGLLVKDCSRVEYDPETGKEVYGKWCYLRQTSNESLRMVNGTVVRSCKVTVDHTQIECLTAPGVGQSQQWKVSIDDQWSSIRTTKYRAPEVYEIETYTKHCEGQNEDGSDVCPKVSPAAAKDLHTDGGEEVVVIGDNFGPSDEYKLNHSQSIEVVVEYGPTGTEYVCENVRVLSHTRIACVTQPGIGAKMRWRVFVHDQNSTLSTWWVEYARPEIRKIVYPIKEDKLASGDDIYLGETASVSTKGGEIVRIWGTNFGVFAADLDPEIRLNVWFDGNMYIDNTHGDGSPEVIGPVKQGTLLRWGTGEAPAYRSQWFREPSPNAWTADNNTLSEKLHFIDFAVPAGQGKGKRVAVVLSVGDKHLVSSASVARTPDEANLLRSSDLINYRDPEVLGVNIFEGSVKESRTLFVTGDSFGGKRSLGELRVTQRTSDFYPDPEGAQYGPLLDENGYPIRIGGGRAAVEESCEFQMATVESEGWPAVRLCTRAAGVDLGAPWLPGTTLCAEHGKPFTLSGDNAVIDEGTPPPAAGVDWNVRVDEQNCVNPLESPDGFSSRVRKHSCRWDADAKKCRAYFGDVQQINTTEWGHEGVLFEYWGILKPDPQGVPDMNGNIPRILEGFVELDVTEIAAVPSRCGEAGVGACAIELSNTMYFASYSPQVWSVAAGPETKFGQQESFEPGFKTAMIGDEYTNANVTGTKYYEYICGEKMCNDVGCDEPPYSGSKLELLPYKTNDLVIENKWCGPCVGRRICYTLKMTAGKPQQEMPHTEHHFENNIWGPNYSPFLADKIQNVHTHDDAVHRNHTLAKQMGWEQHYDHEAWEGDAPLPYTDPRQKNRTCGLDANCMGSNKAERVKLWYSTNGNEGVTVFGRYMTVKRSQLTVTVGPRSKSVRPYPATIAKITKLNQKEKVFRLEFFTPPGQGINQQLIVKRGAQASSPVIINYRPPHISKVRLKDCDFDIFGWDADPVEGDDIGADGKSIAPEWPFGKVAARPKGRTAALGDCRQRGKEGRSVHEEIRGSEDEACSVAHANNNVGYLICKNINPDTGEHYEWPSRGQRDAGIKSDTTCEEYGGIKTTVAARQCKAYMTCGDRYCTNSWMREKVSKPGESAELMRYEWCFKESTKKSVRDCFRAVREEAINQGKWKTADNQNCRFECMANERAETSVAAEGTRNIVVSSLGGTIVIYGEDLGFEVFDDQGRPHMFGKNDEISYPGRANGLVSQWSGHEGTFKAVESHMCNWVQYMLPNQQTLADIAKGVICPKHIQEGADYCSAAGPQAKYCYCSMKIECYIPPGQGAGHEFRLVVGDQESEPFTFSYAAPHVQRIDRGNVNSPVPTAAGTDIDEMITVTLTGNNFGLAMPHILGKKGYDPNVAIVRAGFGFAEHDETNGKFVDTHMKASRLDMTSTDLDAPCDCREEDASSKGCSTGPFCKDKEDVKVTIGVHDCAIWDHNGNSRAYSPYEQGEHMICGENIFDDMASPEERSDSNIYARPYKLEVEQQKTKSGHSKWPCR
jgi:hypothetical protein